MNNNKPQALVFYQMDYQKWESAFRAELKKGKPSYFNWLSRNATPIELSDKVYKEIIFDNPLFSTGFENTVLDENANEFKGIAPSNLIYFTVNPDPYLRVLNVPFNKKLITPEIVEFSKILQDISDDKIYVFAVYDKLKGWFNYDKTFAEKQKLAQEHEAEIKGAFKNKKTK